MVKTSPNGANSVDLAAAIEDARRRVAASGLKQRFMQQDRTGAFEAEQAMSNGDFARSVQSRSEDSRETFEDNTVTSSSNNKFVEVQVTVDSPRGRADKPLLRNKRALRERMKRARAFQEQHSDAMFKLDKLTKSLHPNKDDIITDSGMVISVGDDGVVIIREGRNKAPVNTYKVKVYSALPHIDLSQYSAAGWSGNAPNDDEYVLGRDHRHVDDSN